MAESNPQPEGAGDRFGTLHDPETLRDLVERLQEGVYITDRSGRILDANPAFLRMLGVASLADLRRYRATDLLADPAERDRELQLLERQGSVREFELQLRRPDGQLRTVLDTAVASPDSSLGETVYHGILVDTDRKSTRLNSSHSRASRMPSSA